MNTVLDEALIEAIKQAVCPVVEKFQDTHKYIALGWELNLRMSDGCTKFQAGYGSMKGYKKHVKAIHDYRTMLEKSRDYYKNGGK